MPTAARLVAAVLFALLAWYTTEMVKTLLPEGTRTVYFAEGNALIGWLFGWVFMGPRVGDGMRAALGIGLTNALMICAAAIFVHAGMQVYDNSIRLFYDGPMDAIVAVFEISIEYGTLITTPQIISTLILGGFFCGGITEWAGNRWS